MFYSKLLLPTTREVPADAEVASHKLMFRTGMIRKVAAGVHTYLPLGLRVIRKVEGIVREEMNRAGAQEVLLPFVQPSDLWEESGRWDHYGKELLRFKDRHDRWFCLGPTHEEIITDLVRREVRSYRQLPLNLYQIHIKFRDEVRPRFGVMRAREFIMKDGYSFDAHEQGAEETYKKMYDAYSRIFSRCGLKYKPVEAVTGNIGGKFSHEFMVLAESGEDTIVSCTSCGYAASLEKAEVRRKDVKGGRSAPRGKAMSKVKTPGVKTVEEVSKFLGVSPQDIVKTIICRIGSGFVAAMVRGDHELNLSKLGAMLGSDELEMASEEEIQKATGAPMGFAGPVKLGIKVFADNSIAEMESFVTGANEEDHHLVNVSLGRDVSVEAFGDIRMAQEGDGCPKCEGALAFTRGIEVGHIFKLGTKYSQAMRAVFLDKDGKEKFMVMGCYGIGITRTVAAAIEQGHDSQGASFPLSIAPFQAIILPLEINDVETRRLSEKTHLELEQAGVEVLYDDRDERPGVKFKDADLLGIPIRITFGPKAMKEGKAEIKMRDSQEVDRVDIGMVTKRVLGILEAARKKTA